ncbi:MAG: hypothetical protein V4726_11750 [Verrucomicrobiota bacterium]
MTFPRFRSLILSAAALGAVLPPAAAHQMWIEDLPSPASLVVRFGEFGEGVEKSPGYLDSLTPVEVWQPAAKAGAEPVVRVSTKKSEFFSLNGEGIVPELLAQTGFPVMGKPGAPGKLPLFYLRWHQAGPAAAATSKEPAMTMDIVPEGAGVVRVYFRGQPVPQAALTLWLPGGVESPLTADAEGRATVPAVKAGLILITVNQKEPLAGFQTGKVYDTTSHNASLAWRQS